MPNRRDILIATSGTLGVIGIVLFVVLMALSFKDVQYDEYAIEYYKGTRTVRKKILEEGKQYVLPSTDLFIYPRVFVTQNFIDGKSVDCISSDGIYMGIHVTYQYQLRKNEIRDSLFEYGKYDKLKEYLYTLSRDVIKDVCGTYTAEEFILSRGNFENDILAKLNQIFGESKTHADIGFVQVRSVIHPQQYEAANQAKQVVEQKIDVALNERTQILTEAKTRLLEAQEEAKSILIQAESEALSAIAKANATATATLVKWEKREIVFGELMKELDMDTSEFVEIYLRYLATIMNESPVINMKNE